MSAPAADAARRPRPSLRLTAARALDRPVTLAGSACLLVAALGAALVR